MRVQNILREAANVFREGWSIGIYTGKSPFNLEQHPGNPVISACDITDAGACFTADPFIIGRGNEFYMFFEVLNAASGAGEIGLAKSPDCTRWSYDKIVLKERFHLSYPLVFSRGGNYYMIPESYQACSIRLYRADNFPYGWRLAAVLKSGSPFLDPTLFRDKGMWWLFAACRGNRELRLFYSLTLHAENWKEHPLSPVATGKFARPAGRVLTYSGRIFRFSQDPFPVYGSGVAAHEIIRLDTEAYAEEPVENSLFSFPRPAGWNEKRMHHIDFLHKGSENWIAAADGCSGRLHFRLKISCRRLMHFARVMKKRCAREAARRIAPPTDARHVSRQG